MRIVSIDVFEKAYPVVGGSFRMSGGRVATTQDSTIVRVETDEGIVGWGEQCAFTPNYLVGHGPGHRATLTLLAPELIGLDPRQLNVIRSRMDAVVKGHAYAKSAVDIACWDILGKATGLRVCDLLGGTYQERFPVYVGIGVDEPAKMVDKAIELKSRGYRHFQIKVGTDWRTDVARVEACLDVLRDADHIIVDANGYWSQNEALAAVSHLDSLDVQLEQPCGSIRECAVVRRHSRRPLALDESITSAEDILAARDLDAGDATVLKLSRFGGITPVREARDLCLTLGLNMTLEDSAGGDIVTAAMAHLTASVPELSSTHGYLASGLIEGQVAEGAPVAVDGFATVPTGPGLGISVHPDALGPRLVRYA